MLIKQSPHPRPVRARHAGVFALVFTSVLALAALAGAARRLMPTAPAPPTPRRICPT